MLELKGKPVADSIFLKLSNQLKKWSELDWAPPNLTVVLVGNDPASQVYVQHKQKACEKLGFVSQLLNLNANISQEDLENQILDLARNSEVDGILIQLPLPKQINSDRILDLIPYSKDADGITSKSLGMLITGHQRVAPCTPAGIIEMLKYYHLDIVGKRAVVIGRSRIVGMPLFHLLVQNNATVTLAHSKSLNLKELIAGADYVFVAAGKPHFLEACDFKKDCVVVDIGIHRSSSGLVGDVNPMDADKHLFAMTPVPGGVGPLTIAMLMQNTFKLAEVHRCESAKA